MLEMSAAWFASSCAARIWFDSVKWKKALASSVPGFANGLEHALLQAEQIASDGVQDALLKVPEVAFSCLRSAVDSVLHVSLDSGLTLLCHAIVSHGGDVRPQETGPCFRTDHSGFVFLRQEPDFSGAQQMEAYGDATLEANQ